MRPIGPFALTPGTATEIDTGGDAFSSATVVLYNLSGYECLVTATGGHSGWLVAHTADRFDLADVPGWSGVLTVLPQELASNAGQAPSQMIIGRVFSSGEQVPGIYPLAIDRLSNVGNSVATVAQGTSAIQTGETPPNFLVRAAPAGYASDTLDLIDTGETHIRGLSNNALVDFLNIIPSTTGPATAHLLGQADSVPASGVLAGTLAVGVILPPAQLASGTLPAGVTVPAANVAGTVASATAATQLTDGTHAFTSTIFGPDQVLDGQYRPVATAIGFGATWWDGTAIHIKEVISPAGLIAADTVPAAGVIGGVPSTQQVDATNSGSSTTPQVRTATASVGLAVQDTGVIQLYPTAPNGTARSMKLGYIDTVGGIHDGPTVSGVSHGNLPPGGLLHPSGDVMPIADRFSGSGAGTYTHGLNVTPNWVGITENVGNSTETVGVDSIGSTTVHVNLGVGGSAFIGAALAM